jgi:hypothetical protein
VVGPVLLQEVLADLELLLDVRGDWIGAKVHSRMQISSLVSTFVDVAPNLEDSGLSPLAGGALGARWAV